MSDNAFGIPEEILAGMMVNPHKVSTVVRLTHEQLGWAQGTETEEDRELDRKRAEVDKQNAQADYSLAVGRHYEVKCFVALQVPGPLRKYATEQLYRHTPSKWDGERYYSADCVTCTDSDFLGDSYQLGWPCEEFEALEKVMNE